ncbi:TetR/AcrR family transcriptional regulator [Clostridium sp. P21]|uniref:TetR/AcrR family transcriptional regulator n=1 Tax=Clostridium muellerianum TaxID=2716538 RepID=A0A7Y0HNC6_9CLOT|nr:TetR/AcrR family transcriptional regulator [Clostridium muellerianum]NMM61876.1 TetR/AcrR family transcriptional regulator [Clostridium muellerianum]
MSPRKFDWHEREKSKAQMLEAGYKLIRQYGMTHTSVEKVAEAAGLGKGTFYNFFPSKEYFVYEVIQHMRKQLMEEFEQLLDGRDKLPQTQAREFLKQIIFSDRSIYKYLTSEDEEKLRKALPPECFLDTEREAAVMERLFEHMEGVRSDMNRHLVANLIKIMALAQMNQSELHTDALKETLESMYSLLFSCIFVENKD